MWKKLILLAGLGAVGTAQAVVIDDFSVGSFSGEAPIVNQDLGPSSGGFDRILNAVSNNGLQIQVNEGLIDSAYAHSQDAEVTGVSSIEWALGGLDVSDDDAFRLELIVIDLAGLISFQAIDGSGGDATVTKTTQSILLENDLSLPAQTEYRFDAFGGVDFTDLDFLILTLDGSGTPALDFEVDFVMTIADDPNGNGPEPLPLLLLGLTGLVLGARRWFSRGA